MLLPDLPRCRVLGVSETVIDTWWCRRECDPFWRFYSNRDPGASVLWDGGRLALEPDACYLVPAWVTFKGRCAGPIRHRYVHFQVIGLPEPWLRRAVAQPVLVPGLAWDAEAVGEAGPARQFALHARLCQALARVLAGVPPPRPGARHEAVVAPALRLIESRLAHPPAVAELAAACGVGPDHLARCFAAVVGRTPARWIQERRITAAAERLAAGDEAVAVVSAGLGFANPFHFTRVFRRVTGTTPGEWRRNLGQ